MRMSGWVCCALLLFSGCEEKSRPAVVPVSTGNLPSQESWKSTVTFSDSARIKAILWSGHISSFTQQNYTLLEDSVHVDFFDDQQLHTSLMTARRGKVNDLSQDFEAYDNVVVISDSGTVLRTERLFWTNATRRIHTDAFVDITSPKEHLTGIGMESDEGLKNYKIFKVTGEKREQ